MKSPLPSNRHTLQAWLRTIVVVAVAMVGMETFVVMGIVLPTRIEGSSMAPALVGAHARIGCPHCEHAFNVAADQLPSSRQFWCPDCGERFATLEAAVLAPGERMWLDRIGLVYSDLGRYKVIVARSPRDSTSYCIKRVLGLPGEHIDFDRGDLVIHGKVARKSLDEQLRLRQLVHYEREKLLLWHSAENKGWQWNDNGWRHTGEATRLTFSRPGDQVVTDELGVNQTIPAKAHEVADLMVTCDAKLEAMASLTFVVSFPNGRTVGHTISKLTECSAVWSLFDRQAMLAIDGRVVWNEMQSDYWSGPPQLSLVAAGGVEVHNLTVWRDIYYHTRPVDQWPAGGVLLAPGQLFVAGDNQAVSDDCRSWLGHCLPHKFLIGVPIGVK